MIEEGEEFSACPFCGEGGVRTIGKTADGSLILHCDGCDRDVLVKDVTGKVKVSVEVKP